MSYATARDLDRSIIPGIHIGPLVDGTNLSIVASALHRASREVGFIDVTHLGIRLSQGQALRKTDGAR